MIGSRSISAAFAFALPAFRVTVVDLEGGLLGRSDASSALTRLASGFLLAAFFGGGGTGNEGGVVAFVVVVVPAFALVVRVLGAGTVEDVLVLAELLVAILGFSDMSVTLIAMVPSNFRRGLKFFVVT